MDIKANIKFILEKRGMTQAELARKMGVSKQSIQHYLNDNITLGVVRKLAEALDTTTETIVSDTPLYIKDELVPKRSAATATKLVCPHCGEEISIIAK